jgi:hypothetical protein
MAVWDPVMLMSRLNSVWYGLVLIYGLAAATTTHFCDKDRSQHLPIFVPDYQMFWSSDSGLLEFHYITSYSTSSMHKAAV